jgi:hypothetical protein
VLDLDLNFASTIIYAFAIITLVDPSGRKPGCDWRRYFLNITKKFHAIVDGHLLQAGRPGLRHPLASAMLFVQSAVCDD